MERLAADYLIHIANILFMVGFAVRDVLLLRIIFVSGSFFAAGFYLQQDPPLLSSMGWTIIYVSIHAYWIWRILRERRPVVLRPEEETLYQLVFSSLKKQKFVLLSNMGEWHDGQPGERIFAEGETVSDIIVPISGQVSAWSNGEKVGSLGPGKMVGTGVVLMDGIAPCDFIFDTPTRYIAWPVRTMREFLARDIELRSQIREIMNRDLAAKLGELTSTTKPEIELDLN